MLKVKRDGVVTAKLPEEDCRRLKVYCAARGVSVKDVIREFCSATMLLALENKMNSDAEKARSEEE